MASPSPEELSKLANAFEVFNSVSESLISSYSALQERVEQLDQDLAQANGQLRLALDLLPGAVFVLNSQGVIEAMNEGARILFDPSLIGQVWTEAVGARLKPLAEDEWLMTTVEGEGRRLAITFNPLPDSSGQILLVQDVTKKEELRHAMQRQERLQSMGEMIANLAHQLRTPLSAAILYVSQLSEKPMPASGQLRFSGKALARLQHLEHLVSDMLQFVKGGEDDIEGVPVSELLESLRQEFDVLLKKSQITLQIDNRAEDKETPLGRAMHRGILANILANAVQFSPKGGVISLATEVVDNQLIFHIRDQGPGFNPEVKQRLFEPFFTTRAEGTGLGLAIAREQVRALGGDITAESMPGEGAAFAVAIPLPSMPALSGVVREQKP